VSLRFNVANGDDPRRAASGSLYMKSCRHSWPMILPLHLLHSNCDAMFSCHGRCNCNLYARVSRDPTAAILRLLIEFELTRSLRNWCDVANGSVSSVRQLTPKSSIVRRQAGPATRAPLSPRTTKLAWQSAK
jgi:hypothetical protein